MTLLLRVLALTNTPLLLKSSAVRIGQNGRKYRLYRKHTPLRVWGTVTVTVPYWAGAWHTIPNPVQFRYVVCAWIS
jgi:hypothetical protein